MGRTIFCRPQIVLAAKSATGQQKACKNKKTRRKRKNFFRHTGQYSCPLSGCKNYECPGSKMNGKAKAPCFKTSQRSHAVVQQKHTPVSNSSCQLYFHVDGIAFAGAPAASSAATKARMCLSKRGGESDTIARKVRTSSNFSYLFSDKKLLSTQLNGCQLKEKPPPWVYLSFAQRNPVFVSALIGSTWFRKADREASRPPIGQAPPRMTQSSVQVYLVASKLGSY